MMLGNSSVVGGARRSLSTVAVRAMPAARHLMATHGIDPSSINQGSGKGGRITKGDVIKAIRVGIEPKPAAAPSAVATQSAQSGDIRASVTPISEEVAITSMRRAIARNLCGSKENLAHFYIAADCEIDAVLGARAQLKELLGKAPSVNDMIVRASALALRDVPAMNVHVEGLESDAAPVSKAEEGVHVSVAVATPKGLITPVIRDADTKTLLEISAEVKELAGRAREGRLQLHEFDSSNASITISNLGMFGIDNFNAIIAPPQSAIMAVGGGVPELLADTDDVASLRAATVMTVELSCDRRAVDEITAGHFAKVFSSYMKNPLALSFL